MIVGWKFSAAASCVRALGAAALALLLACPAFAATRPVNYGLFGDVRVADGSVVPYTSGGSNVPLVLDTSQMDRPKCDDATQGQAGERQNRHQTLPQFEIWGFRFCP